MIEPPVVRIPAPPIESEPQKPGFPLVATTAPVLVAGVLFAVTGSPFMLLMAVLGPVIALATLVDGRRQRRRARQTSAARFAAALGQTADRVAAAREAERRRLTGFLSLDAAWVDADSPIAIAVARGAAASGIEVSGVGGSDEPAELVQLRTEAATISAAPLLRVLEAGFEVDGPPVLAAAVARTLALRVAVRRSPATTTCEIPPGEEWARRLPHETSDGAAGRYRFVTGDRETVIAWGRGSVAGRARVDARQADAMTRASARRAADRLAEAARQSGTRPASAGLPDRGSALHSASHPMASSRSISSQTGRTPSSRERPAPARASCSSPGCSAWRMGDHRARCRWCSSTSRAGRPSPHSRVCRTFWAR
jgi:S-DNA-T family DNA segregation ATPase FtsK/SpoIIIE